MAGLEELPPWAQSLATVLMAIGVVVIWLRGIATKPGAPPVGAQKDAIVLSAAIADSASIRGLGESIRRLDETLRNRDDEIRHVLHELKIANDHLARLRIEMRDNHKEDRDSR